MVLEIAMFDIKAGQEGQFAAAYDQARHLLAASDGCHAVRMTQGIETPTRFVLLVEWESVAAHEQFRASDVFPQWRALISLHFEAPPQVEHYEDVGGT